MLASADCSACGGDHLEVYRIGLTRRLADLGFTHLSDAARHEGPLRISLGNDDPDGFMGFAGRVLLEAAGIDLDAIVAAGGSITRHEEPFPSIDDLREGRADLMISEAIMTPAWQRLGGEAEVTFLGLSEAEEQRIGERWGLECWELPAGRFPSLDAPIRVLDFSGWAILATETLPDRVAALIAEAVVEAAPALERHYRHLPVESSPLSYPLDWREARRTHVPLHPAAAKVYDAVADAE